MKMIGELVQDLMNQINNSQTYNIIRNIYIDEESKCVVVVFADGEKQIVKCSPNDEFDAEIGVALALARYYFGSKTQLRKFIQKNAKFKITKNKSQKEEKLNGRNK